MGANLLTYRAELTYPPGIDRSDLAIVDENGQMVASMSWRPSSADGPAVWDEMVNRLGWVRIIRPGTGPTRWRPTGTGFSCEVKPIVRDTRGDQ